MYKFLTVFSVLLLSVAVFQAAHAKSPAPKDASVYIIWPHDGAVVSSPVNVVFGLRNMGVAPAGVKKENTGHFHLIIDKPTPASGKPIPKGPNFRHFGGGQTEAAIKLPAGKHTFQLLMGDHAHVPHEPPVVSKMITITVTE